MEMNDASIQRDKSCNSAIEYRESAFSACRDFWVHIGDEEPALQGNVQERALMVAGLELQASPGVEWDPRMAAPI